jgi:hypothetical protein
MCGCSGYIGDESYDNSLNGEEGFAITPFKWLTGKSFGETKVGGVVGRVPLVGGLLGGKPVGGTAPQGGGFAPEQEGMPEGGGREGGGSNMLLYAGIGVAVLIVIVIVVVIIKKKS